MSAIVRRLFALRPGEAKKTTLLYGMHFIFYLGLRWGDNASLTLFLSGWDATAQSYVFLLQAALGLVTGLLYTSFASRISNERMLLILVGGTIAWLVSVQALLLSGLFTERYGATYLYFLGAFSAFGDLLALHIVNYIADFYDTRSAKAALPVLMSASIAGAIAGGFSARLLDVETMPLAWIVTLLIVIGFIFLIRRTLPAELAQIDQAQRTEQRGASPGESTFKRLRDGFVFVRQSGLLRWMMLGTIALVVLMKLLNLQSNVIFSAQFPGDRAGMNAYLGQIDAISNIAGLAVSSLLFSRLLARMGVGSMNLVFPFLTLLPVTALRLFPAGGGQPTLLSPAGITAALAREHDRVVKKVFRNPLDAMLYNSVPLQMKSRARGFINGLIVPFGTLLAGLLALLVNQGWLDLRALALAGIVIALGYVAIALRLRTEYSRALGRLLGDDEMAIFRAGDIGFAQADPVAIAQVAARLDTADDDAMAVFLAEMLFNLQGRAALPQLVQLATERRPSVRAGVIRLIGPDWAGDPAVRALCRDSLADPDAEVRRAAVAALAPDPTTTQDESLMVAFLGLLEDPDEDVRAGVIPPLIASGDFYFLAPAVRALSSWLEDSASPANRALGLRVLARARDERLAHTLIRYLGDPAPLVRLQAVALIDDLCATASQESLQRLGVETLRGLLADPDEAVRLAAVESLGHFTRHEAGLALLDALADHSFEVRQRACEALPRGAFAGLESRLDSDNTYLAECAAFVLARAESRSASVGGLRARRRALERIEALVGGAYQIHMQRQELRAYVSPGARLLLRILRERADLLLDRVFWLVGALGDATESRDIRRALRSDSAVTRANAAEALESLTSPQIAGLIVPLVSRAALPSASEAEGGSLAALARIGTQMLGLLPIKLGQIFQQTWSQVDSFSVKPANHGLIHDDGWLAAVTLYMMIEWYENGPQDAILASPTAIRSILERTTGAQMPVERATAHAMLAELKTSQRGLAAERSMLTLIERVIFLKQVPVFGGMIVDRLRVLASISEELECEPGQRIIAEGERGDALYVIVKGQVAIQRRDPRQLGATATLAALGPREYFGEMSLFDNEPYSADAVAVEPTQLLLVRQVPLLALIKRYPDMAFGFFKVLSQRLRQANKLITEQRAGEYTEAQSVMRDA
jgi:CRP-like cAMP-binding protein/HEAT repeat protein